MTLALVALSALASGVQAQTAQGIIDLHVKALGGRQALRSVTSLRLQGTVNGSGEFLWQTKAPSAYYLELRHGDRHAVEAFNGKSAWREDEGAGVRTLTGREQARARATGAYRNDRFLTYRKDKTRASLLGREAVEGRPAQVVLLTTAAGLSRKVFFDAQTHLILKEEQEREGGTEEILFGDYRAVDGVPEPHRIRIRHGDETWELAVQQAAHNARLELALFDYPRRDDAPLPDIPTLFKQVQDNQDALDKARTDYTCTKTENEFEIDGQGRIQEKSERTFHVFYLAGEGVEKLVARNGQPLTPDEARREQERVEKLIREHANKAAARQARPGPGKAEEREGQGGELGVSQILRVCRFVNPRRERFRGRDVVVLDFEPRPGEEPKSRAESWIRKLVGNVWIDEQAKSIARLEARMTEAIKMGGGLVLSLQRGSSFVFEQELVNGEVWLPSYAEVHASARFLLVKGFKVHQTQRFSDYKRFEVETSTEVQTPRP